MSDRTELLGLLRASGAKKIAARLLQMEATFAKEFGRERASRWLQDAVLFLDENGILVGTGDLPREVQERWQPGDTWRAFQMFEIWLGATRGPIAWDAAMNTFRANQPAPQDLVLLMAIANAMGKAERLLAEKVAARKRAQDLAALSHEKDLVLQARVIEFYEQTRHVHKKISEAAEAAEAVAPSRNYETRLKWIKGYRREAGISVPRPNRKKRGDR